ncbi:hypothetical protein NP233_g7065 [Leucocoprinus birnbaumii]|uniref:Uncharacterized protein n=1 Tax=Leucocoprinus birnbaumii TaxID=56174 RepID=A0AAD5VQ10_9AGAR|nr:hypothetical protein NP233_g7065 [Leucocoprinus birnbaumii]
MTVKKLEQHICHAANLASKWLSGAWSPYRSWSTSATSNTSVTDLRLVPGSQGTLLFTLSKSVWSTITLWRLEPVTSTSQRDFAFHRCCEWSPRGAIFSRFTVNSNPGSKAKLAVSALNHGEHTVELLSLEVDEKSGCLSLHQILSIPATFKPITLEGDLLAMSDDIDETIIFNWKTSAYATLKIIQGDQDVSQRDTCIQVVFAPQSILVVRSRSVHLFPSPILKVQEDQPLHYQPIGRHSFGWVDSVSVRISSTTDRHKSHTPTAPERSSPLSILVRAETDDPWASDILSIEHYTLFPNDNHTADSLEVTRPNTTESTMTSSTQPSIAYIFPPVLTSRVTSRRGSLRCAEIILGRLGTALWIQPKDRSAAGLYWYSDDAPPVGPQNMVRSEHESLVASVFPGSLFPRLPDPDYPENVEFRDARVDLSRPEGKVIFRNEPGHSWSAIDYDEDVGRIVLGTAFGNVTILDL